jgi:hypothetical protein
MTVAGLACVLLHDKGPEHMMDKVQRAILENQIILAEALWMLLHSQGVSSEAILQNVSARIQLTRELLEEHNEGNP